MTEARNDPSRPRHPVTAIIVVGLQLLACVCLIKGVNDKFTQRPNLTIIVFYKYFWVYISHQKRDQPVLESSDKIETFPSKNTL